MGWKVLEGNHCYSPSNNCNRTGKVPAVFEYPHSARNFSLILIDALIVCSERFPYGPSVTGLCHSCCLYSLLLYDFGRHVSCGFELI
jgi:hypothetical protein